MISVGDKVWVWHFGLLKEVEVEAVTEIQGQTAISYPGFVAMHFFTTKEEALEHRLDYICSMIESVEGKSQNNPNREITIENLIQIAKEIRNASHPSR